MRDGLPVSEFVAPLPVAAVGLLVLNDHLLKGAGVVPGWVTGKLSDLAGLFFFPLFLSAVLGVLTRRPATVRRLALLSVATGLAFAALQLSDTAVTAFRALHLAVGRRVAVTPDPSDLWALPAVALGFLYGRRRIGREADGDPGVEGAASQEARAADPAPGCSSRPPPGPAGGALP